jgi:hypothetical protein
MTHSPAFIIGRPFQYSYVSTTTFSTVKFTANLSFTYNWRRNIFFGRKFLLFSLKNTFLHIIFHFLRPGLIFIVRCCKRYADCHFSHALTLGSSAKRMEDQVTCRLCSYPGSDVRLNPCGCTLHAVSFSRDGGHGFRPVYFVCNSFIVSWVDLPLCLLRLSSL